MQVIAIIALLQGASVYGPPAPSKVAESQEKQSADACPESHGDEIVVCAKKDPGRPQALGKLNKPDTGNLDIDNRGLFRLKIGGNAKLGGGGPKNSVGVGLKVKF